ncbi:MAG: GNAT family N-acetyltransferase [Bacteroidota bacterium]
MTSPILTTERLALYRFSERDAAGIFALNLDPQVLRYTGDEPFASKEDARQFLLDYQAVYEATGMGRWTVRRKSDDAYLGWCGLKRHSDGSVDIGFRLLGEFWNRGYATEAAKACVAYGFEALGVAEIIGRAVADNAASIRVLEKLGMAFRKTEQVEGLGEAVIYVKR